MDLKLIRNLVRIMEKGEVSELEIEDEKEGLHLRLRRGAPPAEGGAASVMMVPGPAAMPAGAAASMGHAAAPGAGVAPDSDPARSGLDEIKSPMVGTFYRASSPDSDPYVSAGTSIDEESVICIIEAMKVMNEIKAEVRGEVVEVLVENGDPVEFGQPLFLLRPA